MEYTIEPWQSARSSILKAMEMAGFSIIFDSPMWRAIEQVAIYSTKKNPTAEDKAKLDALIREMEGIMSSVEAVIEGVIVAGEEYGKEQNDGAD